MELFCNHLLLLLLFQMIIRLGINQCSCILIAFFGLYQRLRYRSRITKLSKICCRITLFLYCFQQTFNLLCSFILILILNCNIIGDRINSLVIACIAQQISFIFSLIFILHFYDLLNHIILYIFTHLP